MSKLSSFIDRKITHSTEKRQALKQTIAAANEQISFYQKQKQLADDTVNKLKDEQNVEKRRIQEKQIRQLRRSFRSPGLLEEPGAGTKDTLG